MKALRGELRWGQIMSSASPLGLTILIVRHAEKPGEQWPGPGLTDGGTEDAKSLVIRGWQRAGAWAALFSTDLGGEEYPRPDVIYAANPEVSRIEEPSHRAFETIIPLSKRLGIRPITDYQVGQESELASVMVSSSSGVILVSWEHKAIARELLPSIAGGQQMKNLPQKWDESRYDLVLRFDRSSHGVAWNFRQLCPRLLAGDLPSSMA
jgi:hypothetical protein